MLIFGRLHIFPWLDNLSNKNIMFHEYLLKLDTVHTAGGKQSLLKSKSIDFARN